VLFEGIDIVYVSVTIVDIIKCTQSHNALQLGLPTSEKKNVGQLGSLLLYFDLYLDRLDHL